MELAYEPVNHSQSHRHAVSRQNEEIIPVTLFTPYTLHRTLKPLLLNCEPLLSCSPTRIEEFMSWRQLNLHHLMYTVN